MLVLLPACSSKDNPSAADNLPEILLNSSFEQNGNPSIENWISNDTTGIKIVDEAPAEGGKYSLRIKASWFPENSTSIIIDAPQGNNIFKLSVWAKYFNVSGTIDLKKESDPDKKSINVADTSWTVYSLIDTINIKAGEKLQVVLNGGISQIIAGETYFDLIKLEQL